MSSIKLDPSTTTDVEKEDPTYSSGSLSLAAREDGVSATYEAKSRLSWLFNIFLTITDWYQ